jgi:Kelch motif/Galactose oxidase, central domain
MKRFLIALVSLGALVWIAARVPSRRMVTAASPTGTVIPAAPMLEPRSGHSATLLPDGRVLIAGGMRRNQDFYRSAELYDPGSGAFKPTGQMHIGRVGQAAVLLRSGKVLIAGGWIGHGATDSAELYDPSTGTFKVIANMTTNRGRPTATQLADGDVLIAGGGQHDSPGGTATAEIFRAGTLRFEQVGPMHVGRVGHTATLLNDGMVLIAGGRGSEGVTATAEIYDPASGQFTLTGSMHTARYKHIAGLLPDGRVLIAGGSDERDWRGNLATAEIYDPRTRQFAAAPPLNDPRFKLPDEAVRLSSGQLLIAGGSRSTEIYDPREGKFLLASGQLSDSWHFMSETLLKDGRVLLAGGYPDSDQATSQTWIYRP